MREPTVMKFRQIKAMTAKCLFAAILCSLIVTSICYSIVSQYSEKDVLFLVNQVKISPVLRTLRQLPPLDELYVQKESTLQKQFSALANGHDEITVAHLARMLVPEVDCPILLPLGNIMSNTFWLCNIEKVVDIHIPCQGYVIGLSEETTFERELTTILQDRCLLKVYNKTVHAKSDVDVIEKAFWINDKHPSKENFKTFLDQDFIRRQGRAIQIAKFAATGDEIALIESVSNVVHICQIVMQTRKDPKTVMRFLSNMRAYCYPLFAKSLNPDGSLSLSFMHCSCTQQYGIISKTHRFYKLQ